MTDRGFRVLLPQIADGRVKAYLQMTDHSSSIEARNALAFARVGKRPTSGYRVRGRLSLANEWLRTRCFLRDNLRQVLALEGRHVPGAQCGHCAHCLAA